MKKMFLGDIKEHISRCNRDRRFYCIDGRKQNKQTLKIAFDTNTCLKSKLISKYSTPCCCALYNFSITSLAQTGKLFYCNVPN